MADTEKDSELLPKKYCKYCKKKLQSGVNCVKCGATFHPSCSERVKLCCEVELLDKQRTTVKHNLDIDNTNTIQLLKEQIQLLRQIISDKETIICDKDYVIRLLQENLARSGQKVDNGDVNTNKNSINKIERKLPKKESDLEANISCQIHSDPKTENRPNYAKVASSSQTMAQKQMEIMQNVINLEQDTNENSQDISIRPRNEEDNGKWEMTQKKPRITRNRKKNIGQSENSGKFRGLKPKVWMYVYRVKNDVNEDDIKLYLSEKTAADISEFDVKFLKTTDSNLKCFMVAADFKFKDNFYNLSFWPHGVGFRRFDFKNDMVGNAENTKPNSFL